MRPRDACSDVPLARGHARQCEAVGVGEEENEEESELAES